MNTNHQKIYYPLLIGDFSTLFLVTLVGFLNHNNSLNVARFLTTFIPLCLAWFFAAPWFELLTAHQARSFPAWWKIIWAVFLCTPLALLIRSAILGTSVQVIFALVMILTSTAAILLWRLAWYFMIGKNKTGQDL